MQLFTPPNHIDFKAAKLFGANGKILDGSIAYIEQGGGGPIEQHTHKHDHLFAVLEGEAKILIGEETIVVKKGESYLVKGEAPHSVWNNIDGQTVMIGISVE